MKKILLLALVLCLCVSFATALTACDPVTEEHTHTFKKVWSYDEQYHWYACETKGCTEVSEKTVHNFENGECSVCEYKAPSDSDVNKVTAEQFDSAITFEGVTSITIKNDHSSSNGGNLSTKYIYLDGNKIKMVSDGVTAYAEIVDDTVETYAFDAENGTWVQSKLEGGEAQGVLSLYTFTEMFEDVVFSDCTYESGYYVVKKTYSENTSYEHTITYKVQFENGSLISVLTQFEGNGVDYIDIMTFSGYNATSVSIPEEYVEIGGNTDPSVSREWISYFDFDNVTITMSSTVSYPENNITVTTTESMKIDEEKWLWETNNYYYDGVLYESLAVYCDGSNAYVNGVLDNEMLVRSMIFLYNISFEACENSFEETADGVFEAAEIILAEAYKYKNVCIVVIEGKIVSVEYDFDIESEGVSITQHTSYTFTSWGETVIDGDQYITPSKWYTYFQFDNVTIKQSIGYNVNGEIRPNSLGTVWKIDGDKWICISDVEAVNGEVTRTHIAYFDGKICYLTSDSMNGGVVESISGYHYTSDTLMKSLIALESLFTKTESGSRAVYTLNSVVLEGSLSYKNIEIVIENDRIQSIKYDIPNMVLIGESMYSGTYSYVFSSYGATTIDYTVPEHACYYTQQVVSEEYLCTNATCMDVASYFYSCECGERGHIAFEYGDLGDCTYGDWNSNNDGTHTKLCYFNSEHFITESCSGGSATCVKYAVCEDCNTEYGVLQDHNYSLEVEDAKFLVSSCGENAEYYKSCVCGAHGEETFLSEPLEACDYGNWISNGDGTHTRTCSRNDSHTETENCAGGNATCKDLAVCDFCKSVYGDYEKHNYTSEKIEDEYMKSPATCEEKAVYYFACEVCGAKGDETFEYGDDPACDYGDWVSNGDGTHTRTCSRNDSHTETENCAGGEATCKTLAVCSVCKAEFGEYGPHLFVEGCCEVCGKLRSEGIVFKINEEYCEVVGYNPTSDGTVYIPAYYQDRPVTMIRYGAFKECSNIQTVYIPSTIEIIETAFVDCVNLEKIVWGATDCQREGYLEAVAVGCNSINTLVFTERVNVIPYRAFYRCSSLETVVFEGADVSKICDYAFSECSSLKNFVLPPKTAYLGKLAFNGCTALESVSIPSTLTEISAYAFCGCTKINEIVVNSNIKTIGERAFSGCVSLSALSIASGVTVIDRYAFSGCVLLEEVSIPDSVKTIASHAFYNCSSIEKVNIGNGVSYIGASAFEKTSLKIVNIKDIAAWCNITFYDSSSNPCFYTHSLYLNESLIKDLVIPDTVENINEAAFLENRVIETVWIPASVKTIGAAAFGCCANLSSVLFEEGSNLTSLGDPINSIYGPVFSLCPLLTYNVKDNLKYLGTATEPYLYLVDCDETVSENITIDQGCILIASYALYNQGNIKTIELSSNIKVIGGRSFEMCASLETIYFDGTINEWKSIEKGLHWNIDIGNDVVIRCANGNAEL